MVSITCAADRQATPYRPRLLLATVGVRQGASTQGADAGHAGIQPIRTRASNDQGREWKGQRLGDMPRRRAILPKQFDPVTNRTIELIDVLWLDGNSIETISESCALEDL